jgi:hypothetical protein
MMIIVHNNTQKQDFPAQTHPLTKFLPNRPPSGQPGGRQAHEVVWQLADPSRARRGSSEAAEMAERHDEDLPAKSSPEEFPASSPFFSLPAKAQQR